MDRQTIEKIATRLSITAVMARQPLLVKSANPPATTTTNVNPWPEIAQWGGIGAGVGGLGTLLLSRYGMNRKWKEAIRDAMLGALTGGAVGAGARWLKESPAQASRRADDANKPGATPNWADKARMGTVTVNGVSYRTLIGNDGKVHGTPLNVANGSPAPAEAMAEIKSEAEKADHSKWDLAADKGKEPGLWDTARAAFNGDPVSSTLTGAGIGGAASVATRGLNKLIDRPKILAGGKVELRKARLADSAKIDANSARPSPAVLLDPSARPLPPGIYARNAAGELIDTNTYDPKGKVIPEHTAAPGREAKRLVDKNFFPKSQMEVGTSVPAGKRVRVSGQMADALQGQPGLLPLDASGSGRHVVIDPAHSMRKTVSLFHESPDRFKNFPALTEAMKANTKAPGKPGKFRARAQGWAPVVLGAATGIISNAAHSINEANRVPGVDRELNKFTLSSAAKLEPAE